MLSKLQQDALASTIESSRRGYLTDIEAEGISQNTMRALVERKFARHEGDGLYRATLAGIAYQEAGIETEVQEQTSGVQRVAEYIRDNPGQTLPEIRLGVDVNPNSVGEYLKTLRREFRITQHGKRNSYRYFPTETICAPRPKNKLRQQILDVLSHEPITAAEISERINRNQSTVHGSLRKMHANGIIQSVNIPVPNRKPLKGWMLP